MMLGDLKNAVIILGLVAMVAAAVSLALSSFQGTITCDGCAAHNASSIAWNTTQDGLAGISNTTSFLGTIGTIIAVVALVTIVISAFAFGNK